MGVISRPQKCQWPLSWLAHLATLVSLGSKPTGGKVPPLCSKKSRPQKCIRMMLCLFGTLVYVFKSFFFFFKIEQMQKALPNMFSEFFLRKPILKAAFFSLFVFGFLNYTSSRGSWTHNLHPNPPSHSLGGRKWNLNYLIYSSLALFLKTTCFQRNSRLMFSETVFSYLIGGKIKSSEISCLLLTFFLLKQFLKL